MDPHFNSFYGGVREQLKVGKRRKFWRHDPKAGFLELAIYSVNANWSYVVILQPSWEYAFQYTYSQG